ncbi:cell division suppressor protein YneA [Acetivibrio saccincola]|jgi:cell division protein YceG involved in septum cleavage|uniref:Cell division suppressor protein YneA n=1 Tax=Acetivibrio saccincola TaxID=1677857 RepID=A0A2K9EQ40_9FIRM|nr:LysM peptidoglycan-binding domain-containing protein [Acetivibrio saccincola]AUG57620.1 Cell division suppressor protein YneA [Acetivibrio saccincola]NLW28079.1 LysM peptidoglycan-binding domain-containing protein [Acetivibrio saccincola]PQQ67520.1 peptidoglycan-binding protein LysM [Acetivibrio saccincola]HOA96745.1 LysM peptidoglycan-binding domain-containing protein [Acetivibrio saccincola]HQD29466.1 LysM peptidoglycan-binding domain-containing protein [Acetivibrio saccincola]
MKKRYVLKNKKRFIFFMAFVITSMFIIISMVNIYGYKEECYEIIKINSGDTLWDIAERYNKKGDIREYIHRIMEINDLENSEIKAGDELVIIVE